MSVRDRSSWWRWAAGLLLLVTVAVGSGLAYGDRGGRSEPPAASAEELAALVSGGAEGRLVVDRQGRPVRGRDGKPLRVARDGRTLLDSKGKPLRNSAGRPLRVRPNGTLPRGATKPPRSKPRRRKTAKRPGAGARPRPRPTEVAGSSKPLGATVTVGLVFPDPEQRNALGTPFGVDLGAVDPTPHAEAVAAHINAGGGIGGRRLAIAPFEVAGLNDVNAACKEFRELGALAVVGDAGYCDDLPAVASIPITGMSGRLHAQAPDAYLPPAATFDRMAGPWVRDLAGAGFFEPGSRLGILWGTRYWEEKSRHLKQALGAAGVTDIEERALSGEDNADNYAQIASFALYFKHRKVSRVLIVENGDGTSGGVMYLFTHYASKQRYAPLYGVMSPNWPGPVAAWSSDQMHGAVGIGWYPLNDVLAAHEGPVNPTRALCADIFRKAGVADGVRNAWSQGVTYGACDALLALDAAIDRSGQATRDGLRAGMESLGSQHTSALTFETRLGPDRHDGAGAFRRLVFDGGCSCFQYAGPLKPFD